MRPCRKNHARAGLMSPNSLPSSRLAVRVFEAQQGHMIEVKPATLADLIIASGILKEAADWLQTTGRLMWRDDELEPDRISHDVETGSFHLAYFNGEAAGERSEVGPDARFLLGQRCWIKYS